MSLFSAEARQLRRDTESAVRAVSPGVQVLARLGYAAKGIVYTIIGGLAARAALSPARQPEGAEGALTTLLRQPAGKVILGILAVGLAGHVLWRLVQALLDPDHDGTGFAAIIERGGNLFSAIGYAGVTAAAVRMLMGNGGGGGDDQASDWSAAVMQHPAGRIAVAVAGAAFLARGLYGLYRALRADLLRHLALENATVVARRRMRWLARAGTTAAGVVYGVVGWLLILAAWRYDPDKAVGVEGALQNLREQPYGTWLLGTVAVGLVAAGLFEIFKGRYRIVRPA